MNKAQAVSIVIPVYNEENHIKDCLDTIAAQTVKPSEVIVVNNSSTDRTLDIVAGYDFVTVIHEPKRGVMWARNAGFNAAKGDIIGRIDADTQLPNDWIAQVLNIFNDPEIAAVSGPVGWHDAPVKQFGLFVDKSVRHITWKIGHKNDAVFLFGSNMAMRRDAWLLIRDEVCMRKDVHEDIDLAIHLYQSNFGVIFEPSLSAMASSRRMNDSSEQLKKYLKVYKDTYSIHDIRTTAVALPMTVILSAHFGVKLIIRGYDPKTQQFSVRKFIDNQTEARVHPM